jgi:hypothetical protein
MKEDERRENMIYQMMGQCGELDFEQAKNILI